LKTPIRAALSGESEFSETVVEATNRRGRKISCRVTVTPLLHTEPEQGIRGTILVMDEVRE